MTKIIMIQLFIPLSYPAQTLVSKILNSIPMTKYHLTLLRNTIIITMKNKQSLFMVVNRHLKKPQSTHNIKQ